MKPRCDEPWVTALHIPPLPEPPRQSPPGPRLAPSTRRPAAVTGARRSRDAAAAAAPPLRPPRLGSPRAAEISSSMNNEWKMQPEPRAAAGCWAQRRGQGGSWERGTRGTRKAHPSPPMHFSWSRDRWIRQGWCMQPLPEWFSCGCCGGARCQHGGSSWLRLYPKTTVWVGMPECSICPGAAGVQFYTVAVIPSRSPPGTTWESTGQGWGDTHFCGCCQARVDLAPAPLE